MSAVLAAAVSRAAGISDERALADLRRDVDEDVEAAVRDVDFRVRALGYQAIGRLNFAQKKELLRRGLEDESPAARGAALLSLELMSRGHPGTANAARPLLHTLANSDPNATVRRLAVLCLKNGSPAQDTLTLLGHLTDDDEEDAELRRTAATVLQTLKRKAASR
jgi:HEAT repeat protein